jgi:hypothetical protein
MNKSTRARRSTLNLDGINELASSPSASTTQFETDLQRLDAKAWPSEMRNLQVVWHGVNETNGNFEIPQVAIFTLDIVPAYGPQRAHFRKTLRILSDFYPLTAFKGGSS